ncbi:hypothetical protein E0H73_16080 [Kribbella pittospori]|uniref:Uncharacterized protein n=1 Tax=Kribbella pittospori TaxID=722689 RepID=A0A4V2MB88_9ACTN|nr:hypothetical protein [Kribbella pittospori]TCC62222.1 hypothetical protein E0H73_16080 [Kribbella pittospori]
MTVAKDFENIVQKALARWDEARGFEARGELRHAFWAYSKGIGYFLSYLRLTDRRHLVPVHHAMGTMCREIVRVAELRGSTREAVDHARMGLAATHLAAPSVGRPAKVRQLLRTPAGESMVHRVIGGDAPPLTVAALVTAAAESRLMLADLLRRHPGRQPADRWTIGTGERVSYPAYLTRYRRAVLPSCAGMDETTEMRQLAVEAVLTYDELCRSQHGSESAVRRATETLARIEGVVL